MPAPTVAVTVSLTHMGGPAIAGIVVTAVLDVNEVYDGFVIAGEVSATTDVNGVAVLSLFPNAPSPTGLGTRGSTYRVTAGIPGGRQLDVLTRVPNTACNLHEWLVNAAVVPLSDAEAAVLKARQWANQNPAPVETTPEVLYSAKYYSLQSAGSATVSQNWAQFTGGDVPGAAAGSRSSKGWSQEDLRGSLGGSSKDWAQGAGVIDTGTGRSARSWSQDSLIGATYGGSARDWAMGAGLIDGVTYKSARAYAEDSAGSASASQTSATASETSRQASGVSATNSAGSASASAASASSANSNMLTAIAQASLASIYALSAASVAQQDLSGVTAAALHRSPNAVVAMQVGDVRNDSDPSWPERCGHLSWMQRALNGAWLPHQTQAGFQSEMEARDYLGSIGQMSLLTGNDSTFDTGVGSWVSTGGGATIAAVSGRLRLTASAPSPSSNRPITTVVGQRYRIKVRYVTAAPTRNSFVGAGTSAGSSSIAQITLTPSVVGQDHVLSFTATGTTTYLNFNGSSTWVAGEFSEIDDITVTPVSFSANPSGAYYPLSTDGKFYRLWKNVLQNSGFAGGTSGTWGSGAVAPTNWAAGSATGSLTFSASSRYVGISQVKYVAAAERPYLQQSFAVVVGLTYVMSFFVEAITSGSPLIQDVVSAANLPTGAALTYRKNGGTAFSNTAIAAGDFVEMILTVGSTAGTVTFRHGLGATATVTADVTLSPPQLELVLAGGAATAYEDKAAGITSQSETFDGNTARFPRQYAIVAEAANVTIYALDQPGRPMWWRIAKNTATSWWNTNNNNSATSVAMREGYLVIGRTNAGAIEINFAKDAGLIRYTGNDSNYLLGGIARRQLSGTHGPAQVGIGGIANATINAVSMTTMPDAPVDPVTGLQLPTIGVACGSGNNGTVGTVLMNDGSAVNYNQPSNHGVSVAFTKRNEIVWGISTGTGVYAMPLATSTVSNVATKSGTRQYTGTSAVNAGASFGKKFTSTGAMLAVNGSDKAILIRENPANQNAGLGAWITGTYNTGWMTGDIRRCLLADTVAGTVSNPDTVADRSYKARPLTVNGTLSRTAVAAAAQLVAYSGFSNANYLQEAYHADLDFGTAGMTASFFGSVAAQTGSSTPAAGGVGPAQNHVALATFPVSATINPAINTADWTNGTGWSSSGANAFSCDGTQTAQSDLTWAAGAGRTPATNAVRRWTINITAISGTLTVFSNNGTSFNITATGTYTGLGALAVSSTGIFRMQSGQTVTGSVVIEELGPAIAEDRSAATGAFHFAGMDAFGRLVGQVSDGTTVRTVTSTTAYNNGTFFKARLSYDTSGTLTLNVNGRPVALAFGTPLASLTNTSAVLTVGNSRLLNAAWPGSLCLVKIGATIPSADAAEWIYAQEVQMFAPGAQITLPSSNSVVDLTYDPLTDRWIVVDAANESTFTSLIRTATSPVSAGSISKVAGNGGCKLIARTGTNPGVDVTIPSQNLREELVRRAEDAKAAARLPEQFDWTGGFTASTTSGSAALTSVSGMVLPSGATARGALVSGAGIPANTTIIDVVGTTVYLSAAATATASGVSISILDFILPPGYEARDIFSGAGGSATLQREGSAHQYTRPFDGFRERGRFAAAPGVSAHVRINARRSA